MITALIDGDWVLYAAGFAGQKNELVCPDLYGGLTFKTATSIKERMAADGIEDEHPVYMRYVLDDESHSYHSAKQMMARNCAQISGKVKERCPPLVLLA